VEAGVRELIVVAALAVLLLFRATSANLLH
jgi:hypothetical protein